MVGLGVGPARAQSTPAPETPATADPPTTTQPSAGRPDNLAASAEPDRPGLIQDDLAPTVRIFDRDGVAVSMGGLIQVHLAGFVGSDALLANDDPANREGFRLRRVRVGWTGQFGDDVRLLLVINPLETDTEVGTISDARISLDARPWLRVSLGTTKIPFSRGGLESSRALSSIERPLSVRTFAPERRLGATVEGELLGEKLAFLAGFMNATEGYDPGNQFGGFLYGVRLQVAVWGSPDPRQPAANGVAVGAGVLYEDGPATDRMAGAADVILALARASARLEILCDRSEPDNAPSVSPDLSDSVDRCGIYGQIAYTLPMWSVQPVLRIELFDDDRTLDDAGDQVLLSAGVNGRLYRNTRLQLHYLARIERFSNDRSNDSIVLNVQGEF
ncbi:MAG: OprO/OprP family phosphate-selective porin [Proteobacteria bacterium]|nr:OprO/OprP family phosphate-selective porin [Pseudomonadota bacterium]